MRTEGFVMRTTGFVMRKEPHDVLTAGFVLLATIFFIPIVIFDLRSRGIHFLKIKFDRQTVFCFKTAVVHQ